MLKESLIVGAGGFAGSAARYLISAAMEGSKFLHPIPAGTFTVNTIGSFLIGLFLAVVGEGHWYYLCIAGFCGGFTTFSAFSAELLTMLRNGQYFHGIIYIFVSIAICLLAVFLGMYVGQLIKTK